MSTLREKLAQRLREMRAKKGLSQDNLADMLEMSLAGYSKIERGLSDISLDRIEQIARVLGIEPEELIGCAEWRMYINSSGAGSVIGNQNSADSTGIVALLEKMIDRVNTLERELAAEKARKG